MPLRLFRPASRKPRLLPVRMSSSDLQLQQALRHLPAIGPVRLEALRQLGVSSWTDLLQAPDSLLRQTLPANAIPIIRREAQRDLDAAARGDIAHFIDRLHVADRWRLLLRHWPQCVFLDIETAGLERDADITVIACWNGTQLRLFVNGENLDDFPDFLLDAQLLVTFNGSTFDLPIIRQTFALPADLLPPHVDLRWICRRCDLTGGLKAIEQTLGLKRPHDLVGTDGQEAIDLWQRWNAHHDTRARTHLLRYCAADTIALRHVAAAVLHQTANQDQEPDHDRDTRFDVSPDDDWRTLERQLPAPPMTAAATTTTTTTTRAADAPSLLPPSLRARLQAFLARKAH